MRSWIVKRLNLSLERLDSGQAQGFTLIELAIVLAVIGLLLGGGLMTLAPTLDNAKRKTTNDRLEKLEDAITLYVIQHNYLPCPANGTLASSDANSGISAPNSPTNNCTIANGANAFMGVVPWKTLGIEEAMATDAWGRRFTFAVSTNIANALTYSNGLIRTNNSNMAVYPNGTLTVNDATATISPASNAAYVIVSHGRNGLGGYQVSTGTRVPAGGGTLETENSDDDALWIQNPTREITGNNYFDDISLWRSPSFVIQSCGKGACGNPSS